MIKLTQGNILTAGTQAIVNTVNCVGVMGRGIALQFKKAFPDNFKAYKAACDREEIRPGKMFVFDNATFEGRQKYIVNFPTKRHWRGKSKLEDIRSGLEALVQEILDRNIQSIAIPPLGCGLGGLDWSVVRSMIEETFSSLPDVEVLLFEPSKAPDASEMINRTQRPDMTVGRAALLGLMERYLAGLMDVAVSLLELHKLMYFMQESGEPLRLKFSKGPYGPYAENLKNVLSHIEGHFVTGYGDGGDDPGKLIEPQPDAIEEARLFLKKHPATSAHFQRLSDLIDGFESPYAMELLSTVHWVVVHEEAQSKEHVIESVHGWNSRKSQIPREHIHIAWNRLKDEGWIPA